MSITTDHSKATADAAHTHRYNGTTVPDKSRADRLMSFDPEEFAAPSVRQENWRFSPVREIRALFENEETGESLAATYSDLPQGVTITNITTEQFRERAVRAPGDRASAVAASRAGGAMSLAIAANAVVSEPIRISVTGTGQSARQAVSLEVGANAEATIIIERKGSAVLGEYVSIDVAENASLNLVLIQDWDKDTIHAGEVVAKVGRDGRLRQSVVTLGGKIVRLNTSVALAGVGASVDLYGLYFADAGQHQEHQLFVDHAAPNCRSRVTYKGALAGATARTVWIGDVLIRAAAEGTDTYELNRNLVLTDGARADSVPNLEIETGEIAGAGHASATGRFDEEQMFYLRSRGITEDAARKLVVRGFFADLVQQIGVPEVEEGLMRAIDMELEQIAAEEG